MGLTSAANAYGTMERGTGEQILGAPRSRFNFQVTIETIDKEYVFERIKSATIPDISYDTEIVNQYNVKRAIQSRINYGPSTITFYHTYDDYDYGDEKGNFLNKIIYPYNVNYYNNSGGIQKRDTGYINSVISDTFDPNLGYDLTNNGDRYFIKKIRINLLGPKNLSTRYTLTNCIITDINGDNLAYSDSQPVEVSVTFQPERVDIFNPGL